MARRVPASSEFEKSMTFPSKVDILVSHISKHLSLVPERPLFVAIQGPQGSGKSYLTSLVQSTLTSPPAKLNVAALSIDDLYLPHRSLTALAKTHPENHLLKGRGQPGTHDVSLGAEILDALKLGLHAVELPRFDKSLFNGEGDRLPIDGTGIIIHPPVDVVIMEGWCMGFSPISDQELGLRFSTSWQEEISTLGLTAIGSISRESIRQLNASLSDYKRLWSFFDVFIQLTPSRPPHQPSPYTVIYKWRLEQEHHMKKQNGGRGMSDDDVKLFVDRYIPGYVFFADGVADGVSAPCDLGKSDTLVISEGEGSPSPPSQPGYGWCGKSLRVLIDEDREVVRLEDF